MTWLISESKSHIEKLLKRLPELFKWAVMKIKSSESRSLFIIKGKCQEIKFAIDNNVIPTIGVKSVKSLGRCYSLPLTDRHHWQDRSLPFHLLIIIIGKIGRFPSTYWSSSLARSVASLPLTDRHRWQDLLKQLKDG